MKKLSALTCLIVAAWFLFLIYGMSVLFDYGVGVKKQPENTDHETLILSLKRKIKDLEYKLKQKHRRTAPKCGNSSLSGLDYETARRRVHNGIREFWFDVQGRLDDLAKNPDFKAAKSKLSEHFRSLAADSILLSKIDDSWTKRRRDLKILAQKVRKRIEILQNPKNCKEAKKILCNLNKGCGFGCQVHHAAYCFITAYSMNRTLILQSKPWSYSDKGWTSVFLPLSMTNGQNDDDDDENFCIDSQDQTQEWSAADENSKIISLPIVDSLQPRPVQLPLAFPREFSRELLRLHNNPPAWFIGQFINYMWRLQPDLKSKLEKASSEKFRFDSKGPVVGVHVRRTDKVGSEAAFHSLDEYMKHVDEWFEIQDTLNIKSAGSKFDGKFSKPEKLVRRVYLATDDPQVVVEAKKRYTSERGYEILADSQIASTAGLSKRYSDPSLLGVIFDIHFLAKSRHLVCTFSSQVCRLAYELMQAEFEPSISLVDPDHAEDFRSLDDVYYFGGQSAHQQLAILDHEPDNSDQREIELKIGDVIGIAGNHWDGYSKGQNMRTDQTGLYPSYKVQEYWRIEDFPRWPNDQ